MSEHTVNRPGIGISDNSLPTIPKGNLRVVTTQPFNAEMPAHAWDTAITPTEHFYVRNHFALPELDPESWQLQIDGAVQHAHSPWLDDLRALPSRRVTTTMACAGNNRLGFTPLASGEPWGSGAVSTATWQGVPLRDVLASTQLRGTAVELLFTGADEGVPSGEHGTIVFARSLPIDKALDPDTLLAYAMNDAPLPPIHGGPVRLIVPGWYGMASVKWLICVTALEHAFEGYFQSQRYMIDRPGRATKLPLQTMRVEAAITSPRAGDTLNIGEHTVRGVAWSGDGSIAQVDVRADYDGEWQPARLIGESQPHAWQTWEWIWNVNKAGRHVLQARATDAQDHTQPEVAEWNRYGYANNAIQSLVVAIHDR
ncbi:MAG: sulfite oxidase [Roseiflexaceae bacterium]|nr:sulfite oxidase [Roseiflexaceae bacterium]